MRNRSWTKRLCLGVAACALIGGQALAQGGGGGGGGRGGGGPSVDSITVTAGAQQYRSSIDAKSYSIADDLQTTSGSIADALKNVPSLEVDVQGNVSLRGDSSVTILIDGKPAGAFRGEGRADALQQMQADQIERVEVMTNPSAAFDPDGGGGVINLITKKGKGTGASGSARINLGTEGRNNGGVSGAYNGARLALSGDIGLRNNVNKNTVVDQREQTSSTGVVTRRRQDALSRNVTEAKNLRLNADYDLSKAARLSAELRHNRNDFTQASAERYLNANAAGVATGLSDRVGTQAGWRTNTDASLSYRHTFGPGHDITFDVSLDQEKDRRGRQFVNLIRLPAAPDVFEVYDARTSEVQGEVKVDYVRPMPGQATLKTGYDFEQDDNDYNNMGARGPSLGGVIIDANFTNRFHFRQTIQAAYATYERPFGDLTVQAGLRAEHITLDINQLTSALREDNAYSRLYPSLHLGYRINDSQQLTASYSNRVRRPRPEDLNPFRIFQDPFNLRAGNPRLAPQQTHSVEAGYQYRRNGAYYLATLFYRQSYKGISDVVRDLGGGVLLTTRENLSKSRSGGLELVANGKVTPKLSYSLTGTGFWNQVAAGMVGGGATRSAYALNGRANLNWQLSPDDLLQISGVANGKRLTAQGFNKPSAVLNLGYRHRFNDRLALLVTAQDVLKTARNRTVVDTPLLRQTVDRRPNAQAVFVGLSYSFGATPKRARDAGFEFDGQGGGEAQ